MAIDSHVTLPSIAIPIHWGTFGPVWMRHGYPMQVSAAEEFSRLAREIAPDVPVPEPGETFTMPASPKA